MPSTSSSRVEIIPPGTRSLDDELAQLDLIADLLDSRFVIPGTNIRFGLDGLIGLIPGIGDVVSALISLYLFNRAAQLGLSPWVKARMLFNIALDTTVGAVPVVGDAFDVAFKSNRRNIALVRKALHRQRAIR
ncbi:MAG: DUF4112 domain-containing protein [Alphaproteobacteria bacterium]|nr:DUF4112 domain-containing protein [Alphaproteobacteria bacterium]